MDNIAGPPVEGKNFYGRADVVTGLEEKLHHHDLLLLGPRRIGKTSAARAVLAKVRAKNWRALEINVASCVDERDFLTKLLSALQTEMATATSKVISAITEPLTTAAKRIKSLKIPIPGAGTLALELGDSEADDWTTIASELLQSVAQTQAHWLIYVDELPILLFNIINDDPQTGVRRVRRFLDWFRNDIRGLPDTGNMRWLLSGSVGLDTLAQEHNMADAINSLLHVGLAAFSEEVAVAMLAQLAKDYDIALTNNELCNLVTAVQWPQPYYLQVAFHHLRTGMAANTSASPNELIEKAIDNMVQAGADNDFHHWEKRLHQQLSPSDADHALALLGMAAQDPSGMQAEVLFDTLQARMPDATEEQAKRIFIRLRDILQRDAYWFAKESAGVKRYQFCLAPLRRWWLRRNTL